MEPPSSPNSPVVGPAAPPGRPLIALGGAGSGPGVLASRAGEEVETWLASGGGALWIQGRKGWGRTTLAGAAIRRVLAARPSLLLGALRIAGTPGARFEEALSDVNQFFRQLGIKELDAVLDQRTSLASKISILLEALRRHPVLLWFDDFEELSASGGAEASSPMKFFAHGWSELQRGAGRLLLITEDDGPDGLRPEDGAARVLRLDAGSGIQPEDQRNFLRGTFPLPEGVEDWVSAASPLENHLRRAALAAADPRSMSETAERLRAASLNDLVIEARALLDPVARRALDAAAVFRSPLGRGALRTLVQPPDGRTEDEVAAELVRRGMAEKAEEEGWAIRLHPAVAAAAEADLREKDAPAWKHLQKQVALHHLEIGNRTGSIWHLLHSRDRLFSSDLHKEAYEVQKSFLEELLRRGMNELARLLLLESARTTEGAPRAVSLGNLAIIHKNEGDLDEAVRLYDEVRKEFEGLGDLPNIARVYHQLGNTHYLRGDLDMAIENYQKSLAISVEIEERAVSVATRIQIANVQYLRGQQEEALASYRETLDLAEEIQDRAIVTAIHLQLGQLLFSLRRMSEAEEELLVAEREATQLGDRRNLVKVYQLLGLVAAERRDYDQAVLHMERAAETAGSLGDPAEISSCFLRIGMIEAERLAFGKAAASIFRALDLLWAAKARAQFAGNPGDLDTYRKMLNERLDEVAVQVGPEAFARILKGLGREHPYPVGKPTG
jgi:tetratricopeptide (TPR) repeat protein